MSRARHHTRPGKARGREGDERNKQQKALVRKRTRKFSLFTSGPPLPSLPSLHPSFLPYMCLPAFSSLLLSHPPRPLTLLAAPCVTETGTLSCSSFVLRWLRCNLLPPSPFPLSRCHRHFAPTHPYPSLPFPLQYLPRRFTRLPFLLPLVYLLSASPCSVSPFLIHGKKSCNILKFISTSVTG